MESQPQNPEFRNNPGNFHPMVLITVYLVINVVHRGPYVNIHLFHYKALQYDKNNPSL